MDRNAECGSRVSENFASQARAIAAQLAAREKDKVCVLLPSESTFLAQWDIVTALALVYTALLSRPCGSEPSSLRRRDCTAVPAPPCLHRRDCTAVTPAPPWLHRPRATASCLNDCVRILLCKAPFEVAFLAPPTSWLDLWFLLNRAVDLIFLVDIGLQFFIAFTPRVSDELEQDSDVRRVQDASSHVWITDHRRIWRHYLLGWFPLDIVSIIPSLFDFFLLMSDDGADGNFGKVKTLRVVRVLRIIKLVRLLRASRVVKRWSSRIAVSYAVLTMLECLIAVLLSAHWYACIFALQATLHDSPMDTWLGFYGYCAGPSPAGPSAPAGTPPATGLTSECAGLQVGTFYLAAFSWSTMVITGTGGTGAYPSPESAAETVIVVSLVLLGALLWTQVLANLCEIATNSDPARTEYRQTVDDLNRFCSDQRLPPSLRRRLRQYFAQRRQLVSATAAASVIHKMSSSLQAEVVLRVHQRWLRQLWFLRGAEDSCLVRVALKMEPCVFAPAEVPESGKLYVLQKGVVLYGGRVLSSGRQWGEDVILHSRLNHSTFAAHCMTYVEAYSLSRSALLLILDHFPHARQMVRRAALKLALRRTVLRMAASARAHHLRAGSGTRRGGNFVDHLLAISARSYREGHDDEDETMRLRSAVHELRRDMEAELRELRAGLSLLLQAQGLPAVQQSSRLGQDSGQPLDAAPAPAVAQPLQPPQTAAAKPQLKCFQRRAPRLPPTPH